MVEEIWLQLGIGGAIALYTIKTLAELLRSAMSARAKKGGAKGSDGCSAHAMADTLKETATQQRLTAEAVRSIGEVIERHDREERVFQVSTQKDLARIEAKVGRPHG